MSKTEENLVIPNYSSYKKDNATKSLVNIIVIVASLLFCLVVFYMANERVAAIEKRLAERDSYEIVLDKEQGVALLGVKEEITPELRKREYEAVARAYFKLMYGFNKYTYENNMKQGLLISGDVGTQTFAEYEKKDMYSQLVNENLRLIATVDSVATVEYNFDKARGYLVGYQRFVKPLGEGMYKYIVEFVVENVGRSNENVSGGSVMEFNIKSKEAIELKDLSEYD